jgi:hypothetical protein
MSALILIAIAVGALALSPKVGVEDRPGFNERTPLV